MRQKKLLLIDDASDVNIVELYNTISYYSTINSNRFDVEVALPKNYWGSLYNFSGVNYFEYEEYEKRDLIDKSHNIISSFTNLQRIQEQLGIKYFTSDNFDVYTSGYEYLKSLIRDRSDFAKCRNQGVHCLVFESTAQLKFNKSKDHKRIPFIRINQSQLYKYSISRLLELILLARACIGDYCGATVVSMMCNVPTAIIHSEPEKVRMHTARPHTFVGNYFNYYQVICDALDFYEYTFPRPGHDVYGV